jgi:hypothetical protein
MAYHYSEVPLTLSLSLSARLVGISRESFRKHYLQTGLCHLTTELDDILHGVGVGCVWAWELAQALGRTITVEQVQEADKQLDKGRKWQKQYRARTQQKRTR